MTADELLLAALGFTLGVATGWCWGHATARIRHIPIGALATDDEAALLVDERARFEQLVASLDLPDRQDPPASGPLCGAPHHLYPETLCTEPAGHYRRDRDPHAGPFVIGGREIGGAAWDEPRSTA